MDILVFDFLPSSVCCWKVGEGGWIIHYLNVAYARERPIYLLDLSLKN